VRGSWGDDGGRWGGGELEALTEGRGWGEGGVGGRSRAGRGRGMWGKEEGVGGERRMGGWGGRGGGLGWWEEVEGGKGRSKWEGVGKERFGNSPPTCIVFWGVIHEKTKKISRKGYNPDKRLVKLKFEGVIGGVRWG